jgi:putative FmdB family regulatory protein
MPIYEFLCKDCKERFAKLILPGREEDEEVVCPKCGGKNTQMIPSAFSSSTSSLGGISCAPSG